MGPRTTLNYLDIPATRHVVRSTVNPKGLRQRTCTKFAYLTIGHQTQEPLTSLAPLLDLTISLAHSFLVGHYYFVLCHKLLSIFYYTMVFYIHVATTLPLVSFYLYVIFSIFLGDALAFPHIVILTVLLFSPIEWSSVVH